MPRTRKQAQALLRRYDQARSCFEWRGGGDPTDVPYIEKLYARAKERMTQHLMAT